MLHSNHTTPAVIQLCQTIPPKINSHGILGDKKFSMEFLTYSLPLLELQMGIILMTSHGLSFLLQRYGLTFFICEVLAGIILGPTFLGRLKFMREVVFPMESQDLIASAAFLGYVLFIFTSSVKVDTESNRRSTGKLATVTGVASVLVPLGLGLCFYRLFYNYLKHKNALNGALTLIVMNSFSTFSMVVHVLEELKLPNSELGMLARSSSLVSGAVGLVIAISAGSKHNALADLGMFIAFLFVARFICKPIMMWKIRRTPQGSSMSNSFTLGVATMALVTEACFRSLNQLPSLGAYSFGIMVPAGPPLGSAIVEKFDTFVYTVLMPLAIVTAVMRADLFLIISEFEEVKLYLVIIILILIVKVIACLVPSLYMSMPVTDSMLLATMMTSRGTIELVLYKHARDSMAVSEAVFALLVLYTLVNNTAIAMNVKKYYDPARKFAGYEARNITSLKPELELRILACVHRPDNIISTSRMIDAFHPNKERSIHLCVLHLVNLVGRSSPILWSHKKQKPLTNSSSHNLIVSLNQYEQSKWGRVTVSSFTALSSTKMMNEDISLLALDQLASLILLPLHRKWSVHGNIESEDKTLRTVNCRVLEKCPCSVGVFFDRGGKLGRQRSSSKLSICVIFLGGKDDREALSLAKRIAMDSLVHLTIIHLVPNSTDTITDGEEEVHLDSWALADIIKQKPNRNLIDASCTNVEYKQILVNDGPGTALVIHSIADEYDLFLVGRRYGILSPQTTGLSDWTELPELGVIGDMFASQDINTKAAVLVLQQQRKLH